MHSHTARERDLRRERRVSFASLKSVHSFSPLSPVSSSHFSFPYSNSRVCFCNDVCVIEYDACNPPLFLLSPSPSISLPKTPNWGGSLHPPKDLSVFRLLDGFDYEEPLIPYNELLQCLPSAPKKHRSIVCAPLKPVSKSVLNYGVMLSFACNVSVQYYDLYSYLVSTLSDVNVFLSLFSSPVPCNLPGRPSQLSDRDVDDLKEWSVISSRPRSVTSPFFLHGFKVLKSDPSWSRFILDCSPLNLSQVDPPSFSLPSPHIIILSILECEEGFVVDFTGWFFQHEISDSVAEFFPFRVRSHPYLGRRRAQGWKFSPVTAHTSSEILAFDPEFHAVCPPPLVWIDDLFFGDKESSRLTSRRENFVERCKRANAQIGSMSEISSSLTYVGMEFDLHRKKWRVKSSWAEKTILFLRSFSISLTIRVSDLWRILGLFIWFLRCSCRSLAILDPLISQAISLSLLLRLQELRWEDRIDLWPSSERCCSKMMRMIVDNSWRSVPHSLPLSLPSLFIFSDASLLGGAVVCEEKVVWSRRWDFPTSSDDIFYLETLAWAAAINFLISQGLTGAITVVDNQGLYYSLLKTRAKDTRAGNIICKTSRKAERAKILLFAGWISTDMMPADAPSRGENFKVLEWRSEGIMISKWPFVFATDA